MTDLAALVRSEIETPVRPQVADFAAAIAAGYGNAARAVLFYGSCLRADRLEGEMLDFYCIVSDYRAAFGKGWLSLANRMLPPNVFPSAHEGLQAKVAVLSEADFARLCSIRAGDVSVWARFAQPSRLAWAAGNGARDEAVAAIVQASVTLFHHARPMAEADGANDPLAIWRRGFALTYGAELRAERADRPGSVVDADPARYESFGRAALAMLPAPLTRAQAEARWRGFRRRGKALTLVRLAKATTTYAGGIDYIAWKINRHAGADVRIKPWQRRHPILGALTLLPRLIVRGAVR